MNRIFNTNHNHSTLDIALLILRVGIAGLILTHGVPKLTTLLSGDEIKFADPFGFGMTASLAMAAFAEFFCAILVLLGLATRFAVIPLMVTMLVALITVHAGQTIKQQELALIYLLVFSVLLLTGAGGISVDRFISGKAARLRRGY